MPIRFVCEYCQQRLSVSSRKVGAQSKCPSCKRLITVPTEEAAQLQLAARSSSAAPDEDPFSQFAVFDEDTEWVYEQDVPRVGAPERVGRVDPEKVAVSRHLLYMQGGLLAVVGLLCFGLGILVGGGTRRDPQAVEAVPQPCTVAGTVRYQAAGGGLLPDDGAVVVILPQDARPEQKAAVDGLVPDAPYPAATDPGLQAIQSIGGEYARAGVNGEYRIRLPDRGKYHVLVLSRNARRSPSEELRRVDLAQLGDFFMPAPDLLGPHRYRWQQQSIRRDVTLDVDFN